MNIVYLIGNGFDINLGMRTRYNDFYEFYCKTESNHKLIASLKASIGNGIHNWANLELALGKYTLNLKSREEFDIVYEDLGEKLSQYLEEEENKFDITTLDQKKLFSHLVSPEKFLPQRDQDGIKSTIKSKWANDQNWLVNILTFNYTRIIDNIIGALPQNYKIGENYKSTFSFNRIEHIHGYTNDRRVMGVNDVSQISNESFHQNQDIVEALVKPICNQSIRHTIDDQCIKLVSNAHIICIFGSSIGDTDKLWWTLIGEQLKNSCILIIYDICEKIDLSIRYKFSRYERERKNDFLSKTILNEEEKKEVYDKVYVGLNTEMFLLRNI